MTRRVEHRLKNDLLFPYRHFVLQAVMKALYEYGRRLVIAEADAEKHRHELASSQGMFPVFAE